MKTSETILLVAVVAGIGLVAFVALRPQPAAAATKPAKGKGWLGELTDAFGLGLDIYDRATSGDKMTAVDESFLDKLPL